MKFLSENTPIYTTLSGSGAGTTSYPDGLKYKTDYMGNIYFIKEKVYMLHSREGIGII